MHTRHDLLKQDDWDAAYPSIPARPLKWPPWFDIQPQDLGRCMQRTNASSHRPRVIWEVGAGDARRIHYALDIVPELNDPAVSITCVDISRSATLSAGDRWTRVRLGLAIDGEPQAPRSWQAQFRALHADGIAFLQSAQPGTCDLLIDWMLFHGLQGSLVDDYTQAVLRLRPRHLLLKCFSVEGNTIPPDQRHQTVPGIDKRMWSRDELVDRFGSVFHVDQNPWQCPEDKHSKHADRIEWAKREYSLRLR